MVHQVQQLPHQFQLSLQKSLCFDHRDAVEKTKNNTSGTSQEELHCKQEILKLISKVVDDVRNLFAR